MMYTVKIGEKNFKVEVDGREIKLNGKRVNLDFQRIGNSHDYSLIINNKSYQLRIEPRGDKYHITIGGKDFPVEVEDERNRLLRSLTKAKKRTRELEIVKAPMPGLVVKVLVDVGQRVRRGQGVAIVEAMKMENEIKASTEGVVKEVRVREKDAIDKDAVLVVIG